MGYLSHLRCKCGKEKVLHVPFKRIYKLRSKSDRRLREAEATDNHVIAVGAVEDLKALATDDGCDFIDGTIIEACQCQCGSCIDVDKYISGLNMNDVYGELLNAMDW